MPVILESDEAKQMWLLADGNDPPETVLQLLRPYEGSNVVLDEVSPLVNSVKNVRAAFQTDVKMVASGSVLLHPSPPLELARVCFAGGFQA